MNIFAFLKFFGSGTKVTTTTLADIEARLDEKARVQERAAAILQHGYGYIPAPPGALVIDNSTSEIELASNTGMVKTDFMVYDKDGYVPANEWAELDRDGKQYLASLTPMRRDPVTGRPTRD